MRNCLTLLLLLGLLSNNTGCTPGGGMALVAAPPPPMAVLPRELDRLASPPAAGLTRIILDADGKRATVTEVLGWSDSQATAVGSSLWVAEHGERARPICITPCEFDFEPGLHILRFDAGPTRVETVRLQVGSRRKLVRVAVGYEIASSDSGTTGVILQTLGASVAVVGAMLWASSAAAPADKRENLKSTGIALTLGGAAGFLLGVPLAYRKPGTRQPSSITEVTLPPSAQTAM